MSHTMCILVGLSGFPLACGGDAEPVEVISSTLTGTIDGNTLNPVYGVANTLESGTVSIATGNGELNCGSQTSPNPPGTGVYLNVQIPEAVVGIPSEHAYQFFIITGGDLNSRGSNGGSVEVTALTEESIALTLSYDQELSGAMYQASGTLEVVRCD